MTRLGPSFRFRRRGFPRAEHAEEGLAAQVGQAIRVDLPEMGVQDFERDMAVVSDPAEMLDDRTELKVSLARQNTIAVSGQLTRCADQVADLDPREVLRGQLRQVLGLARTGEEMEHIEADAGIAGA